MLTSLAVEHIEFGQEPRSTTFSAATISFGPTMTHLQRTWKKISNAGNNYEFRKKEKAVCDGKDTHMGNHPKLASYAYPFHRKLPYHSKNNLFLLKNLLY